MQPLNHISPPPSIQHTVHQQPSPNFFPHKSNERNRRRHHAYHIKRFAKKSSNSEPATFNNIQPYTPPILNSSRDEEFKKLSETLLYNYEQKKLIPNEIITAIIGNNYFLKKFKSVNRNVAHMLYIIEYINRYPFKYITYNLVEKLGDMVKPLVLKEEALIVLLNRNLELGLSVCSYCNFLPKYDFIDKDRSFGCEIATRYNSLEVLKCLRKLNFKWSGLEMVNAIAHKNADMLLFCAINHAPILGSELEEAFNLKHKECVRVCLDFHLYNDRALQDAFYNNRIEFIEFCQRRLLIFPI